MDYSKLSDQEINVAVAEILHPDSVVIESKSRPPSACITGHLPSLWVDYCNNPADTWPIILRNRISIMIDETTNDWSSAAVQDYCDPGAYKHSNCHKNPLRAAMITFLLMQDSANVQDNPA